MKQLSIIMVAMIALVGCATEETYESVSKEIKELRKELKDLNGEIEELEDKREDLDTTKEGDECAIVYTTTVKNGSFQSFVEVHGVVQSDKNVVVMPEFSGVIRSLNIKEGSMVRKGQVLARVDTDLLYKNLAELNKRLEFADSLYVKQKRLWEKEVGSEIQHLQAKNNKETLEQSISTLKTQIGKSAILSPIDGKVNEVFPNLGEMVSPATPFARIVNTKDVYIEAEVSEAFFGKIAKDDEVRVRFPYQNDTIFSKIEYIGNYINPNNRTFKIHIGLKSIQKSLPPNLLSVIRIKDVDLASVVSVPSNVIQNDGTKDYVFVTDGKIAHQVEVSIGASYNNLTVVSGPKSGDQLVYKGNKKLAEGTKVKVNK